MLFRFEADLAPVAACFFVERRTAFLSFTSDAAVVPAADVRVTASPDAAAYRLFATQGHTEAWLAPQLERGEAFACVLAEDGAPAAACFAFAIYGNIWEIGGVVTAPSHRRKGLGAKVVRAALQGAVSVAGLLITTEAMVAERPDAGGAPGGMPGGGMGGMGGGGMGF